MTRIGAGSGGTPVNRLRGAPSVNSLTGSRATSSSPSITVTAPSSVTSPITAEVRAHPSKIPCPAPPPRGPAPPPPREPRGGAHPTPPPRRVHGGFVGEHPPKHPPPPPGPPPEGFPPPADPGHDSLEVTPRSRQRPKTQRVQQGDRTSAHGDDIAEDASDSCRRALVRLDRGRVVVGLDLEDGSPTSPYADRAGGLARALKHGRPRGRQLAQQLLRRLVGAVLRPQHAEHPELDVVGRSLECLDDDAVLVRRERDLAQAPFVDLFEAQTVSTSTALCMTERKSFRPSVPPSSGSAQRSG